MVVKILQNKNKDEDKVLRKECEPVKDNEFGSKALIDLIQDMRLAASQDEDGVAVAAPQLGVNKRIFLIDTERGYVSSAKWRPEVFINPVIVKYSNKQELKHEGCLSVRGIYGDTWRCMNVTVEARDINGNKFTFGAGGITAHIIQHEIDHLDGILFIDHGINLVDDPDWRENFKKK
jgi:peptide deformylase